MLIMQKIKLPEQLSIKIVSVFVLLVGVSLILEVLFTKVPLVRDTAQDLVPFQLTQTAPLIAGLSFIYLSLLLRRRKRSAWYVTVVLFGFYLLSSLFTLELFDAFLATIGLYGLMRYRRDFIVKSGISSLKVASRNAILALALMFVYGVLGFMLLDARSFDTEVTLSSAVVSTVDAFGIVTEQFTSRNLAGNLFLDSLYIMTLMTYAYVLISLFGPIKQSYVDQTSNREAMLALLEKYSRDSEDFFKIWPADKHYYFYRESALAYKVVSGIALVVGNPVGNEADIPKLLKLFVDECHINDWTVSFVHIDSTYRQQLMDLGFELQKLGQEAIIKIEHFNTVTVRNKHFRNVKNRFDKQGFTAELVAPPFSDSFVQTLREVSDSWLTLPGKSERSFMLGYFDSEYINRCSILIVKNEAGEIIAFTNQVPGTKTEANVDLMRHQATAPPNVNDFMFISFFKAIEEQGFETANLGLCPLVGIDDIDESTTVITNFMKFVYQNGNRFFGFTGLARFKSKFDPEWRNRYIAYQDGIVGFSRAMNSLNRAMQVKK